MRKDEKKRVPTLKLYLINKLCAQAKLLAATYELQKRKELSFQTI